MVDRTHDDTPCGGILQRGGQFWKVRAALSLRLLKDEKKQIRNMNQLGIEALS